MKDEQEKVKNKTHQLNFITNETNWEFTYTPPGGGEASKTSIPLNKIYKYMGKTESENKVLNNLGKYCKLRFEDEKSLFHHTLGKIKSFFYGKPYNLHEKLQAMELVTSLIDENGRFKDEMPERFQNMQYEDFERVLGALNNGRLKTAVNKYLYENRNQLQNSNPGIKVANVDDIINKLNILKKNIQTI